MDVCRLHFRCMEFNTLKCVGELSAIKLKHHAVAFHSFSQEQRGIDSYYVDGISLTHGRSPRQHIWSFACAVGEQYSGPSYYMCQCIKPVSEAIQVPLHMPSKEVVACLYWKVNNKKTPQYLATVFMCITLHVLINM